MSSRRGRRKKRIIERVEKKAVDRILRAAFTGEQLTLVGPATYMGMDDYKKLAVDIAGEKGPLIRFYIPAMEAANISRRYNAEITAREAFAFFNKHRAHVVYPLLD
jgi:hypothetical protein